MTKHRIYGKSRSRDKWLLRACGTAFLSASACVATPALASGTTAGTQINNTATATYSLPGGGTGNVTSNTVSLLVDELLDVSVAWADGGDVSVFPGATGQVLTFTVTNNGNGGETFELTARNSLSGDDFDPAAYAIYLDTNGDGDYDPGVDQAYVAGSNDPVLAADASATVFLVSSIGGSETNGERAGIDLIAVAATGSGAPGTTFANQGQGGGNAVVGATGADGEDDGYYAVSAATVSFVKSAVVSDPFGGSNAVPGSTITYTLIATVNGSGSLADFAITDAIPADSTYSANSLTLQGSGLSDPVDADAGEYTGSGIAVRLGTVPAGQSRTVTFAVTINN